MDIFKNVHFWEFLKTLQIKCFFVTENIIGFYWRMWWAKKVMNLKYKMRFFLFPNVSKNAFWFIYVNLTIFNNKHIYILHLCSKWKCVFGNIFGNAKNVQKWTKFKTIFDFFGKFLWSQPFFSILQFRALWSHFHFSTFLTFFNQK